MNGESERKRGGFDVNGRFATTEDLRVQWPKLAYTEFSTANLGLLEDVLRLLEHPGLNIKHKQKLSKIFTSLKALADITSLIEDRVNRMLLSLKRGEELDGD